MRDKERHEVVELDGGIDELGDRSFDDCGRARVLNGSERLERVTSDLGLFLESGFRGHGNNAKSYWHERANGLTHLICEKETQT